jgi:hypothetical protein
MLRPSITHIIIENIFWDEGLDYSQMYNFVFKFYDDKL